MRFKYLITYSITLGKGRFDSESFFTLHRSISKILLDFHPLLIYMESIGRSRSSIQRSVKKRSLQYAFPDNGIFRHILALDIRFG